MEKLLSNDQDEMFFSNDQEGSLPSLCRKGQNDDDDNACSKEGSLLISNNIKQHNLSNDGLDNSDSLKLFSSLKNLDLNPQTEFDVKNVNNLIGGLSSQKNYYCDNNDYPGEHSGETRAETKKKKTPRKKTSSSISNIRRNIKRHFSVYAINYINKQILSFYGDKQRRKFGYVLFSKVQSICTIKDFLSLPMSNRQLENKRRITALKNENFKTLLKKRVSDVFEEYMTSSVIVSECNSLQNFKNYLNSVTTLEKEKYKKQAQVILTSLE